MEAQTVNRDGRLLLPHDSGCCGADVIIPDDPRYADLERSAVVFDALAGTPEEDAAVAARWRRDGLGARRTA